MTAFWTEEIVYWKLDIRMAVKKMWKCLIMLRHLQSWKVKTVNDLYK